MSMCGELLAKRSLPEIWNKKEVDWETRRREIADLLQKEMYGYRPGEPDEIHYKEMEPEKWYSKFCAGKATLKKIEISGRINGRTFAFPMYASVPKENKNLPFFVHINFRPDLPDRCLPIEEIIDNGFAVFSFGYQDVTSDENDFHDGLAGAVFGGRERTGSDCGKIALWSWAASRVMDYCQTLDCLDFNKAAVVGHSRLGKTALLTGMLDERFRFVFSNESGCQGAALSRGKVGEQAAQVEWCRYWYAPDYAKYSGKEFEMPFDQHFLLAAVAPRFVYAASAIEDTWCDPDSEYLSCCAASSVYEQLGMKGLIHPDRLPVAGDVFNEGCIGYHIRKGCHYFSREDWKHYMAYIKTK